MSAPKSWDIYFFQRHRDDDLEEEVPAKTFLDSCPDSMAAKLMAIIDAVAAAPPPRFAGGGMWEAMHADMQGIYEVRVTGPKKRLYRLFCVLENPGTDVGLARSSIVLIDGRSKPVGTALSKTEYRAVRALAEEFRSRRPRSVDH